MTEVGVAQWLTTAGLALDVVGAAVLFLWPPPGEPLTRRGAGFLLLENEVEEQEIRRSWDRQLGFSRAGLALVGIGFILQLVGMWLPA